MRKLLVFVIVFVSLYSKSQTVCAGSSATLQAPNPQNLANPQFTMNPGVNTSTSGVYVVSPNVTTTYTFIVYGQGVNGFTTTTSVETLTVYPQPLTAPSLTQASCTSSLNFVKLNLTFNPSTPSTAYTISWTPLPASVLSPQQTTASALTPGPYSLVITPAGGCTVVVNFTIDPQPAPAVFSVTPFGSTHSITCITPSVLLTANNSQLTYTWSSTVTTPIQGPTNTLTSLHVGSTWTLVGTNTVSGCTDSFTFQVKQNIDTPTLTINPTLQTINCGVGSVGTVTSSANPAVNITHFIYAPASGGGGVFISNAQNAIYNPGGVGTFTDVLMNNASGCTVQATFTVNSAQGFPTFTLNSPQQFTLGCGTKSVATINIVNANTTPQGGVVNYALIGPPTSTAVVTGTASTYTVNVPGTWTVIVEDDNNLCQTRTPISIIQNTFGPSIGAQVPRQILDCTNTITVLQAFSETPNAQFNWAFVPAPGNPPNVNGSTITVNANFAASGQTVTNTFTLTTTDPNNACKSTSVIPIYQNLYAPNSLPHNGGQPALTCLIPTVTLGHSNTTNIPSPGFFPSTLPVIGYLWEGPTPQQPLQVSSTYVAGVPGVYTLTAKDLNNGCTKTGTVALLDQKIYPVFVPAPTPSILDCGSVTSLTPNITSATLSTLAYTWTPPATATTSPRNNMVLTTNYPGTYTLYVQNTVNKCAAIGTLQVVTGSLNAGFSVSDSTGYAPLKVDFTNTSKSQIVGPISTLSITSVWRFGNGDTLVTRDASITATANFRQPGTYRVKMFARKGTCIDTVSKIIRVEIPSRLEVPNVFTPNDDGVNDVYRLNTKNVSEIKMVIYDRWGHLVYELTSDNGNIEWDGKNQYGIVSAEGTYFYVVTATGKDGTTYDQKGTISLIR